MAFEPGRSGNPGGRPRELGTTQSKARKHTDAAIAALVRGLDDPDKYVMAANSILDRGWGKPAQVVSGDADNPLQLAIRAIERVIVDPQPKQLQAKPLELHANPVDTIDDSVNKPLTIEEP